MMNGDQILSTYETVSRLTGQMLAAAQANDWDNLAALESHCASCISTLKAGETPAALSGERRARKVAIIHQIMAHDREIRSLTEPWMAELSALMQNTGTQRKLALAYDQR